MKPEEGTFTLQELAERSGVNPRTIHFYIARGLLEGVGRQGPSSRYPEGHLHRLIFIRELQAQARLSLDEITKVLSTLSPEVIAAVARGEERLSVADFRFLVPDAAEPPPSPLGPSLLSLEKDPPGHATLISRFQDEEVLAPRAAPSPGSARNRARRLFSRLRADAESPGLSRQEALESALERLSMAYRDEEPLPPPREGSWVSIHVSDDITISARGMSPEELRILTRIGHEITGILNRARREADEKEK